MSNTLFQRGATFFSGETKPSAPLLGTDLMIGNDFLFFIGFLALKFFSAPPALPMFRRPWTQQQPSSYSINVAASSVSPQRQRSATILVGDNTERAHDPVSESPTYGLAATVEKRYATSTEGHITNVRDALLGTKSVINAKRTVIMQEVACPWRNLNHRMLLFFLKALLHR